MLRLSLPLAEPLPAPPLCSLAHRSHCSPRPWGRDGRGGCRAARSCFSVSHHRLWGAPAQQQLSAVAGKWMVFKEKWPLKTLCVSAPMLPMLAGWLGSQGQRENPQGLPWAVPSHPGTPCVFLTAWPLHPFPTAQSPISPGEDGSWLLPAPGPLPPVWLPLLFSPHVSLGTPAPSV